MARFASFFRADDPPWAWLKALGAALAGVESDFPGPKIPPGVHVEGRVWLHPTVQLPPFAVIIGPVWIGARTQLRPGAFLRGNVIAGEDCVLGNSCEYKHALLLDGVETAHFNYVGDSILGNGAHLGAGAICSNLRLDRQNVTVRVAGRTVDTGLKKFGAVLGDNASIGCNAVLNPGTLLGRDSRVLPCMAFSGYLPDNTIARVRQPITTMPRRG